MKANRCLVNFLHDDNSLCCLVKNFQRDCKVCSLRNLYKLENSDTEFLFPIKPQ